MILEEGSKDLVLLLSGKEGTIQESSRECLKANHVPNNNLWVWSAVFLILKLGPSKPPVNRICLCEELSCAQVWVVRCSHALDASSQSKTKLLDAQKSSDGCRMDWEDSNIVALVVTHSMEIYPRCLLFSYCNYSSFNQQRNWRLGRLKELAYGLCIGFVRAKI